MRRHPIRLLARDPWHWPPGQVRQIPALCNEISAGNGDLAIPFEQKEVKK